MKKICAWCNTELEHSPAKSDVSDVSHGICADCTDTILSEPLPTFLERLPAPVVAMENGDRIVAANQKARDLLGKDLSKLADRKPGDVIECVHAAKPGGCGRQSHCKSCTIRRAVDITYHTGCAVEKVLAYPDTYRESDAHPLCVEISTTRVGQTVLLRIVERPELASDGPPRPAKDERESDDA